MPQGKWIAVSHLMLAGCMVCAATFSVTAWPSGNSSASLKQPDLTNSTDVQKVDIHVGTSSVINAPWPVSRVSVTNADIADVQVLTPRQVLLTGNALGSTDLILWSEAEEIWHARVTVLVDLGFVNDELDKLFPDANIEAMQSRDTVMITGQLRRAEDAARLRAVITSYGNVKFLDATSLAGVQQVQIQVRVAEVSRTALKALTVNGLYAGDQFQLLSRPGAGAPLITGDFPFGGFDFGSATNLVGSFPGSDLTLFLQALSENQYVRILAEPTLVAMSGERASFLAGGEFPIPVVQSGNSDGGITIEYREFGVKLEFTPTVLGDNSIRLYVAPEVSDLSDLGAVVNQGFSIPSILTRRAETTLELKSGQTFAMAGLMNQNTSIRNSRIPLLGDLPVIGTLFRSVRYQRGETELIVLATATLVEPSSQGITQGLPGDNHVPPSDWELFIDGKLEGKVPALAPADADWMREMGLNRLQGPGAFTTHSSRPATSRALPEMSEDTEMTAESETVPAETSTPEEGL